MDENNEKKIKIKEHEQILNKTLILLDKSKSEAQRIVEKGKEVSESMDKSKDNVKKDLTIVQNLPSIIPYIQTEQWREYNRAVERSREFYTTLGEFSKDLEAHKEQIESISSTASTFSISTSTSTLSTSNIFLNIPVPTFQSKMQEIKIKDTTSENIEFIRNELNSIKPQIVKDFESVTRDWSGTGDIDLRYKILLNLRSVIFHQLLDDVSPESKYSKAPWFQHAATKTKRFCQVKFFILGFFDEVNLPPSVVTNINTVSLDLQKHFEDMSNFGKYGGKSTLVENSFRETISSFSIALKLKKQFYKSTI